MKKITVYDMERTLRARYPEEPYFPLVRTLAAVSWELGIPVRVLIRSLKNPGKSLWKWEEKLYVPPELYEKWRRKYGA